MAEKEGSSSASAAPKPREDNMAGREEGPKGPRTASGKTVEEKPTYKGDVFTPGAHLLKQIAEALGGGAQSDGVKAWLTEYNRVTTGGK
jgi:hypothetical protein